MKKALIAAILATAATVTHTQAGQPWGFVLGNGAGFYYGDRQQRCESYEARPRNPRYVVATVMPLPTGGYYERRRCNNRSYNPNGINRVYWKASNGAAAYRTNDGQVWVQNPY
jgi:hypothetical protein